MNPSRLNVLKKLSLKHPLSPLLLTDRVRVALLTFHNLSWMIYSDSVSPVLQNPFGWNRALHDVCSTECLTVPFYRDATSTTCSECFCSPNLVFESAHCMPFHSQLNSPWYKIIFPLLHFLPWDAMQFSLTFVHISFNASSENWALHQMINPSPYQRVISEF